MDLKTILKSYGCCGGDRDDLSVSSSESHQRKVIPPRRNKVNSKNKAVAKPYIINENQKNVAPDTHWPEVEGAQMPLGQNVPVSSTYTNRFGLESAEPEDYFTPEEPIDFDSWNIGQVAKEKIEEQPDITPLAKNSKKIHKETPVEQRKKPKISLKDKDNKDESTGKIKRTPWKPEEDVQVLDLLSKWGPRWAKIATTLPGRTGKQVRDRYTNKLKPNIKKDEWTKEEEELFTSLCEQYGHKWSKIASFLPGRTEGQAKNKYYAQFRRKIPKSDAANDISPENLSEEKQSLDQTVEVNEPKGVGIQVLSNNEKIEEETILNRKMIQEGLDKYVQAYKNEERMHLKDSKEFHRILSPNHPRLIQNNDPTSVISYNTPLSIGCEPTIMEQKYPAGQVVLSTLLSKRTNENKSLQEVDTSSSPDPKIENLATISSYGEMRQSDEGRAFQMSTNCCDGMEVLSKCDQLTQRIDKIEYLLYKVLTDIKEMKFQENRDQLH